MSPFSSVSPSDRRAESPRVVYWGLNAQVYVNIARTDDSPFIDDYTESLGDQIVMPRHNEQ